MLIRSNIFSLIIYESTLFFFFFFNDTAPPEIYTLSLHAALPISPPNWFCNLSLRILASKRSPMTRSIQKAAVLGAGTMGARIAAHFANAGLPCILLDIVPPDLKPDAPGADRNKIVRAGLDAAKKSRPAAFFTPALAEKVSIGNFEDDLARVAEADWIIEVVAENLEIKRKLLSRVAQFRKPGAIVTTNTSGLPVHLIA